MKISSYYCSCNLTIRSTASMNSGYFHRKSIISVIIEAMVTRRTYRSITRITFMEFKLYSRFTVVTSVIFSHICHFPRSSHMFLVCYITMINFSIISIISITRRKIIPFIFYSKKSWYCLT